MHEVADFQESASTQNLLLLVTILSCMHMLILNTFFVLVLLNENMRGEKQNAFVGKKVPARHGPSLTSSCDIFLRSFSVTPTSLLPLVLVHSLRRSPGYFCSLEGPFVALAVPAMVAAASAPRPVCRARNVQHAN